MNMVSFLIKLYEIFHVKTPEKLVYSAHYFWQLIGPERAF